MKKHRTRLLLALPFTCLVSSNTSLASYTIVLPSQHENGFNLHGSPLSAREVIDWEVNNSDLVFGAYADKNDNESVSAIGYMYNQKLDLNSGELENEIRNAAERNGIDYEDFFLHFSEDTILAEPDTSHGANTLSLIHI